MRAAERRWRRAFERIVLASLTACQSDPVVQDASADVAEEDDGACRAVPSDQIDDAAGDCAFFMTLPCGFPDGTTFSACYPNLGSCAFACNTTQILYCNLAPSSCDADGGVIEGPALVECSACGGGGRRPRGLAPSRACSRTELGDYFAHLAYLERASVHAFESLAKSLASHGAPRRLISAAREAAGDERRHARSMTRLARRFGGVVSRVRIRSRSEPTLSQLLEEDAIEGCASETFGALVATWQGRHARDSRVRTAMRRVARDETRHAALAWEIFTWGMPKLSVHEQKRVRRRLDYALRACTRSGLSTPARRTVGYPNSIEEQKLANELRAHVNAGA